MTHVIDVFQYFCEAVFILHDGGLLRVEKGGAEEEMKVLARILGPENLPESHRVAVSELSFEPDEEPAETEVEISALFAVKIVVEHGVDVF